MKTSEKYSARAPLFFMMAMISACAGTPHLNIIHNGDTVAILSPADIENDNTLNIHNQAIGEGAKTGAATGAVTGAAYGLTCGPFFIICSPIGALAGAIVGVSTGAIVGTTQGLDREKAEQANANISNYLQQHNPQDELLAMVITRAANRWQVISVPAERTLIVQFDAVGLRTKKDGPVVLVLQATAIVNYPGKAGKRLTRTQKFEYESSPTYIDSWVDEKAAFLELRFDDAYQTLAENIVIALSDT